MDLSPWAANANPLENELFSSALATLPVLYLCWAIAIKKMRIHHAALSSLLLCAVIAVLLWGMPLAILWRSLLAGAVFGIFPICSIIAAAVFIYLLAQKSHALEIISASLSSVSQDRRIQVLLVAFAFGAFLEASSGFGVPVTISAALLMGLGFPASAAITACLLANTTPVVFGGVGLPVIVGANIIGIDSQLLAGSIARTLFTINIVLPFYLVIIISGWRGIGGALPAILVCGLSYSVVQLLVADYAGASLAGIVAALACLVSLLVLLFFWSPYDGDGNTDIFHKPPRHRWHSPYPPKTLLWAWSPFLFLCFFITVWSIKPLNILLEQYGTIHHQLASIIASDGSLSEISIGMNLFGSPAALLLAGFCAIFILRLSLRKTGEILIDTAKMVYVPMLTIVAILSFSYIMNHSGMAVGIGRFFVATGVFFPFFSPFLGCLGVFVTGSLTASVALFSKMQETTAAALGMNPLIAVSANTCGAAFGKMISPQSLAIVAAVTGQSGKEANIFRGILKHSLLLTALVGGIVTLQALLWELLTALHIGTLILGLLLLATLLVILARRRIALLSKPRDER